MKKSVVIILSLILAALTSFAVNYPVKKVLILVEGSYDMNSKATAMGRELAQLMGHFSTSVDIRGTNSYKSHDIDKYDYIFNIGYSNENQPPAVLCQDIFNTTKPVTWINTGFAEFCKREQCGKKYGFEVTKFIENSDFDGVKTKNYLFSKGLPEINKIQIDDKKMVEVWATAISSKTKAEIPYMVKSGNLVYVADLPFLRVSPTDRYLLLADKLHDILNEQHTESHRAMIRIEDITPMYNPDKLRQVADILSERGIPFLVGVVPIYVNPMEDKRVTLSDKPEVVDALKYMVQNGGSIVMHGSTHQYKGVTGNDGEFWDFDNECPIPHEDAGEFAKKIETGIDEFTKNGLHPIAWETPHYVGSVTFYDVISKYFSTAVEQRMVINDYDYGQYFPYIINKDLYGQKIYPEDLGYVPLEKNIDESKADVANLIKNTDAVLQVRDGIACGFFHPFLDLDLLKTLVDGIAAKGFTFIDLKDSLNWVRTSDKVILSGSQTYSLNIDNSYLHENYYDQDKKITRKIFSDKRIKGPITKNIELKPGETYFAETVDYHVKEMTFKDKLINRFNSAYRSLFKNNDWQIANVKVLWNPEALGSAYNDQSSFVSVFSHINIPVDTVDFDENLDLADCNLLVVPFASADKLTKDNSDKIIHFVENGGNLITECKNNLIQKIGISFTNSYTKLHFIRDTYYPEEPISWQVSQLASKFDYDSNDEIFCEDATTGLPVAIGKVMEEGKIIYLNTFFDPLTSDGYSYYPYLMEYIRRFFGLQPVVKRENLEMYFDPGYRPNSSEEDLVKRWVSAGIRVIDVAGWHQYPKYTYNYAHLIKLAHANGILVYAWIEPPQVSQKFWSEHPEWRETNYLKQYIHKDESLTASWRYPVALTDKQCFKAAMDIYLDLLKKNDFDGVNIAELNFEAGQGFNDPKLFTPMHPSACKEFRNQYGYDLKDIFKTGSTYYWKNNPKVKEQVTDFRIRKVCELHDSILSEIGNFARSREGFKVIVTFYDTYFSPEMTEYHGVSSDKMIELQKKYNFLLQPEDPQKKWSTSPERYIEMGKMYSRKMNDSTKLMLDLNIFSFRVKDEITPFPTLMQTGLESYQLINAASHGAPRFTVYSESSCNPHDLSFFPFASASRVKYSFVDDGLEVKSPCSFMLQLPPYIKTINVDGEDVAGYRVNNYYIPAGEHKIKIRFNEIPGFSTDKLQPELLSFTGNLRSINYGMRKISFRYKSDERALASLNNTPTYILVDDKDYKSEILKGNDCFTVSLPAGDHKVEIITGDTFSNDINLASLWSMSAIAIYGLVAAVLLVILFIILKVIRRNYKI